ncbi:ABC transporter permease [Cellulosimicrobium cellulans]|uniref:FtsX-like permease family protein n=1 Tax=Cellulosimicrobium cellulans TaxID=1710 RepID=UPI001883F654|nr:FtsX-like permease family protein [Cellulosimicrobium cellulans]MBE9928233.1 ABC transporter permease [Cellulosimicrobium cellulans]
MFLALRDLRHARGRFALMTVVVALITFLVAFLAALTAGLGRASTSAVTDLPVDRVAFAPPAEGASPTFTESEVTAAQTDAWAAVPGVAAAEPLGVATVRASGDATAAVTAFGVRPGSGLVPGTDDGGADVSPGTVVLSRGAADALGADVGDPVDAGPLDLTVSAVADGEADYAHTPVVWVALDDWQAVGARGGASPAGASTDRTTSDDAADGQVATVVTLRFGDDPPTADALAATDARVGTVTATPREARSAISSFTAENLSLTLMQVFLLAISALVVGAFFTVWTIQRAGDVAVLRALGASTRYLLRDAIGQAGVVLGVGVGAGTALAAGAGLLASQVMPVVVDLSTTLVPAVVLVVLGGLGAVLAVTRVARVDPHAALAAR